METAVIILTVLAIIIVTIPFWMEKTLMLMIGESSQKKNDIFIRVLFILYIMFIGQLLFLLS